MPIRKRAARVSAKAAGAGAANIVAVQEWSALEKLVQF